eukprot:c23422_g1_i4 orf=796-3618(-)
MEAGEDGFGDNFFREEDEPPVDMEAVREGMKLVPLSDVCFEESDDVMGVGSSMRDSFLSPLELMLPDHIEFQDTTKHDLGVQGPDALSKKCRVMGAEMENMKHAKIEFIEKENCMEDIQGATATNVDATGFALSEGIVVKEGPQLDFTLWTTEDDLLLKNAMEAGAAMEALAKGAIRFSRRFTVWEIKERWRALLYDPEISAQAACRIVKAESSAMNTARLTCLTKDKQLLSRRRRLNCIRSHYYKKRKRVIAEKSSNTSLTYHDVENLRISADRSSEEERAQLIAPSNAPATGGPNSGMLYLTEHSEPNIEESTFTEMVSLLAAGGVGAVVQALPSGAPADSPEGSSSFLGIVPKDDNVSNQMETINVSISGQHNDAMPVLQTSHVDFALAVGEVVSTAALGNSVKNVQNMVLDGAETKSDFDSIPIKTLVSSIESHIAEQYHHCRIRDETFGESPHHDHHEHELERMHITASETGLQQLPNVTGSEERGRGKVVSEAELSESDFYSDAMDDPISDDLALSYKPHNRTLLNMICVLNTEDTNIPSPPFCSDEVIVSSSFLLPPSSPLGQEVAENESKVSGGVEEPDNLDVVQPAYETVLPISEDNTNLLRMAGKCTGKTGQVVDGLTSSDKHEAKQCPDFVCPNATLQDNELGQTVLKNLKEAPAHFPEGIFVSRNCGVVPQGTHDKTLLEGISRPVDHLSQLQPVTSDLKEDKLPMTMQVSGVCQSDKGIVSGDQAVDIPSSMATLYGNEEYLESDEEMARFSDVETMILDMDLDLGDDGSFSAQAESRRIYKQHCKTLARLEQGANAALQRTLTRRGAIAILYGHQLRFFVTKNEVTLGRDTQDVCVDIDLGKEGRANKVSRRQANIKLKEDGLFYLKNLGRRALTVNNKSIGTGQCAILGSNCLIEVGGMRFIFNINRKLVKQRVDEMILMRSHII